MQWGTVEIPAQLTTVQFLLPIAYTYFALPFGSSRLQTYFGSADMVNLEKISISRLGFDGTYNGAVRVAWFTIGY